MDLCKQALEKEQEQKAWEIWLVKYPWMNEQTFVSFDEFYRKKEQTKVVKRTDNEVISDAENILKSFKRSV